MRRQAFCVALAVALCFVGGNSAKGQNLCYSSSGQCGYGGVLSGIYTGTQYDGAGVFGYSSADSGATRGVFGISHSASGTGVFGDATADTGWTHGVYGASSSTSGTGVYGFVSAFSGDTSGVHGQVNSTVGTGVYGMAYAESGANNGVRGESRSILGTGVYGNALATSGYTYGMRGTSQSTTGTGVLGLAPASSGTTYGVFGASQSTNGRGVYGVASAYSGTTYGSYGEAKSTKGRGVYGVASAGSGTAYGVFGASQSTSGRGVYGVASAASGATYGVYGSAVSPAGYAVYAKGRLHVTGDFSAAGTKAAVVRLKGGEAVKLYAEEASENWFSDVGSAKLSDGAVTIPIDPTFSQTVNTQADYHIFLTPEGDCEGLYVANKGEDSFAVRELKGGHSNIAFSYRIMAKRKGYEQERLARATTEEVVALFASEGISLAEGGERTEPDKPAATE
jgi:hypothetical protein